MMFDTLNARDLSLSLFLCLSLVFLFDELSSSLVVSWWKRSHHHQKVSRVSLFLILSHFLLFLLICFLKNSSLHERQQERTFPSLSLSLSSRIISFWRKEESISSSFFRRRWRRRRVCWSVARASSSRASSMTEEKKRKLSLDFRDDNTSSHH